MAGDPHQCPRCELRFTHTSELQEHFTVDHAGDPGTFERLRYAPPRSTTGGAPARRILLVGNQTLDRSTLDAVLERAAGARVVVLVPATRPSDLATPPPVSVASTEAREDVGVTLARWRLRTAVDALRAAGVDADGEVGDADPFTAVTSLLESQRVDEILLSTLPRATSRWLQADLPARLERHCHVPVTTLVGTAAT